MISWTFVKQSEGSFINITLIILNTAEYYTWV